MLSVAYADDSSLHGSSSDSVGGSTVSSTKAESGFQNFFAKLSDSPVSNFVPMILVFVVFYSLVLRPHSLKMKQHKKMIEGIAVGDKILTSGGIIGSVCRVANEQGEILVEIAKNVKVGVVASCVTDIVKVSDIDSGVGFKNRA